MTTFTAGPASATTSSSLGLSGMRSREATPPIGQKSKLGGADAVAPGGEEWPNSCASAGEAEPDEEDAIERRRTARRAATACQRSRPERAER